MITEVFSMPHERRITMNIRRNLRFRAVETISILSLTGFVFSACKAAKNVQVDGSSTVYPITEAVAEEYLKKEPNVRVSVGVSGTGGGFKKFCVGETDISNASRPIKDKEIEKCRAEAIEYIQLPVAYDGLAVVVNKENNFAKQMTVSDLEQIFRYENAASKWKDIKAVWPAEKIKVYMPGQDSGTYDYFVEVILGKKKRVRSDATFSEDDNVLVTGIAGDKFSIGFFGLAYYIENQDKLNLVAIVNPNTDKAVSPNFQTVANGSYAPLSRFIFIYVNIKALQKPDVLQFVNFYMESAGRLSKDVGYIALGDNIYQANKNKLASAARRIKEEL